jgi:hypothetical protein
MSGHTPWSEIKHKRDNGMRKYSQGEGELEILRGEEAVIAQDHLRRTGKSIVDFDDAERDALRRDLDALRPKDEVQAEESSEE